MVTRTLQDLARDLRLRRQEGDPPPVLLLGAGASVESGIGAMQELYALVGCADFPAFSAYIDTLTTAERFRLLARFLQSRRPDEVTPGYKALAALCADAFFDTILTTNLDPLLDDALAGARLWRRDYLLLVNGVCRPDRLPVLLSAPSPRVKVLKLHGDLFHRFMAWTEAEMDQYLREVHEQLKAALHGRDLLVVGHSLRDERIRELALQVAGDGGSVWYTNPSGVPEFLEQNRSVRAVTGQDCTFEKIFPFLAKSLGLAVSAYKAKPAAALERSFPQAEMTTVDDLMSSVVALLTPEGRASGSGFITAKPRRIVADRYSAQALIRNGAIRVSSPLGQFEARVVDAGGAHPFGPVILEAPDGLKAPGLRVDASPLAEGMSVRIGVAAGERTGICTGLLRDPAEKAIQIEPVGLVNRLVQLAAYVTPGSCGAPVVDESFAVRGFIVAGSDDPKTAVSVMYPARRWANRLRA